MLRGYPAMERPAPGAAEGAASLAHTTLQSLARRTLLLAVLALYLALSLCHPAAAQQTKPTTPSIITDANVTIYPLSDSIPVLASLALPANDSADFSGIFFQFVPDSGSGTGPPNDAYISVSLCSGPSIPAYDTSNATLIRSLGESVDIAARSTLVRAYASFDPANTRPGPGRGEEFFLQGGLATFKFSGAQIVDQIWIGIWPPFATRDIYGGAWTVRVAASTTAHVESLSPSVGLTYQDSDNTRALLTSFPYDRSRYPGANPNFSVGVLPTSGPFSLDPYFNSSLCALSSVISRWNGTSDGRVVNSNGSATTRGLDLALNPNQSFYQWEVGGLARDTNYTAWMVQTNTLDGLFSQQMWPAVKFKTKQNDNCRLVYDVPFCPAVGYAIPVAADISTQRALDVFNATVWPNYVNFSTTIDTFPCYDARYGLYSSVSTCDDCKRNYLNWLCAVAMPRCTDSLQGDNLTDLSAASQDGSDLSLAVTETNAALLPYVVNRVPNDNTSASRQTYVDSELRPGAYGEVLPCIYLCYFVARTCPPLIKWACPLWDLTAQRDYGSFADADALGLVVEGSAPAPGSRWGGVSNYVAQDGFGRTFCNAVGVDGELRAQGYFGDAAVAAAAAASSAAGTKTMASGSWFLGLGAALVVGTALLF